ncbi:MAG: sigma-70 family RNA polymerase sigma factor [Candidatus Cloacimonetes bacterium]|jgi:RNA polymerase sigma factor (sigma-70 family)|nr:sigma-70 family RNA polymerase sigma factor [Candidatus Cloacimonadota bacterium]MDD4156327.1 sigma-70 family RNA polymerase sigma factor [Candidatus Cloacimonadota bacterium]
MKNNENIKIEDYVNLVKSIAGKYCKYGLPFEDLVQEGMIGLLEAKNRFKEDKNTAFTTYAYFWIKKKILEALSKETKTSLNSIELKEEILSDKQEPIIKDISIKKQKISIPNNFPQKEKEILDLYYNEHKTYNEIAEIISISREQVRQLMNKAIRRLKFIKS